MCFFNLHQQTVINGGLPVARPASGSACDCGECVATYDTGTGALYWQWTPTGRLVGR